MRTHLATLHTLISTLPFETKSLHLWDPARIIANMAANRSINRPQIGTRPCRRCRCTHHTCCTRSLRPVVHSMEKVPSSIADGSSKPSSIVKCAACGFCFHGDCIGLSKGEKAIARGTSALTTPIKDCDLVCPTCRDSSVAVWDAVGCSGPRLQQGDGRPVTGRGKENEEIRDHQARQGKRYGCSCRAYAGICCEVSRASL